MVNKWKINSIRYAQRVLLLIVILTIVIPVALYLMYRFMDVFGISATGLLFAMRISFASGMVLLALFVLLSIIEAMQDRFLNNHYAEIRNQRLRLAGGYFECPYCGCQKVREFDQHCPTCFKDLR